MLVFTNRPYVDQLQQTDCSEQSLHRVFGLWTKSESNSKHYNALYSTAIHMPACCIHHVQLKVLAALHNLQKSE